MPKVEQDKAIINQLIHSKANIKEIGTEIQHKRLYKIPFIPSKGEADDAEDLEEEDNEDQEDTDQEEESEDDDIIVLPESAWLLNTAQYIYEFAMLAIPLRKVHELDACDPLVIEKLTEIQLEEEPQVEEDDIDPRWSALKNLN